MPIIIKWVLKSNRIQKWQDRNFALTLMMMSQDIFKRTGEIIQVTVEIPFK
jgi:hypothetical protein